MKKQVGTILAAAVGVMFSATAFAGNHDANAKQDEHHGMVKCLGVKSDKGEDFIMTKDEKECTDKGGKVEKAADHKEGDHK